MSIAPSRSVWDDGHDIILKRSRPTDKSIWKPFLVGLLIIFFIGSIVVGAIVTLWILLTDGNGGTTTIIISTTTSSSTDTTTTSTTSTTSGTTICSTTAITTTITSTPLPSQCSNYTMITDATRQASYGSGSGCDNTIFSSPQWVRFSGSAGTMLANCPVADYHCGTLASGWYSGIYPSIAGDTTSGNVCYNFVGNTCNWPNSISITNCNGYYVFYLSAPTCASRYCTI